MDWHKQNILVNTNEMRVKLFIVLILFTAIPSFSQERVDANLQDARYEEVRSYLDSLVKEGGSSGRMKLFSLEEIPALLSFADDMRVIKSPSVNALSSYRPSCCSVGVYALWLIECIRRVHGLEATMGNLPLAPQLGSIEYQNVDYVKFQNDVAEAYRSWWNSGPTDSILSKDPLESTGLHWF